MHTEVTDKEGFTAWRIGRCDWSLYVERVSRVRFCNPQSTAVGTRWEEIPIVFLPWKRTELKAIAGNFLTGLEVRPTGLV
jgi:hypothetical protein